MTIAEAAYAERGRGCGRCKGSKRALVANPGSYDWEDCPYCGGTGTISDGTLDPVRLAILADALEDADCDHADLLTHLRGPGPHVRGCWAVDLLLGKG